MFKKSKNEEESFITPPETIVEKEFLKEDSNTLNFSFYFNPRSNFSFENFIENHFLLGTELDIEINILYK